MLTAAEAEGPLRSDVVWGGSATWFSLFTARVTEATAIAANFAAPEHANVSAGSKPGYKQSVLIFPV
jgi:hypothetical protein